VLSVDALLEMARLNSTPSGIICRSIDSILRFSFSHRLNVGIAITIFMREQLSLIKVSSRKINANNRLN